MSEYNVIRETSVALKDILWGEFAEDDVVRPIVGDREAIVLKNPTETGRNSSHKLSLWLYQVTENEFHKNMPRQVRQNDVDGRVDVLPTPLALGLYYLLTPFTESGESDQLLLGKAMRVFYDNALVLLSDAGSEVAEELRITLSRMTLDEISAVWEALREPYRLSVCYQVRITHIDSRRKSSAVRVVERAVPSSPTAHAAGAP